MGNASFTQSNFLGGEWSLNFSGRIDHPNYRKALARCLNAYPSEEGCLLRRPGLRYLGHTRNGVAGRLLPFHFANQTPYSIELTDGYLRMFNGNNGHVLNNDSVSVTSFSNASPTVMTVGSAKTWVTGTQVRFVVDNPTYPDVFAKLQNRQFKVTKISTTTFNIEDPLTGTKLNYSDLNYDIVHVPLTVSSILEVTTPWTGTYWSTVRMVQAPTNNALLHGSVQPYYLTVTPNTNASIATAVLTAANMLDGPYLDIDASGAYISPNLADATKPNVVQFYIRFPAWAATTSYNVGKLVQYDDGGGLLGYRSLQDNNINHAPAAGGTAYWEVVDAGIINGSAGFTSGDIGRCVRFFSEPPLWVAGTTYVTGNPVTYNGVYYVSSVDANTGNEPDINLDSWSPTNSITVARWTWGRITAVGSGTSPRFTCEILGPTLLYQDASATYNIYNFRFGVYGGGTGNGWPTCGVYHQGRLWLGGAVANRIDASKPNDFFNFEPTGADGTVADNNAISATFNSNEINQIYWMTAGGQGIVCGTKGGEWVVQASALNDPISPTNIQANQVTHYGCANVQPIRAGIALVFVQKYARKVMEFLSDVFSGKFTAPNLTEQARHLTIAKISELAYQEETTPIVWARTAAGGLLGITYRRTSSFTTESASFAAWHQTLSGSNAGFESIIVGPCGDDGAIDTLQAVILDITSGYRHVVSMGVPLDEAASLYNTSYLDDAVVPYTCLSTTVNGVTGIQIYGLWHLNGRTVDVWACGLDCGSYAVSSGTCFVPYGSDSGGLFTLALAQSLDTQTALYGNCISRLSAGSGGTRYYFPLVVGFAFTTECQILRPGTQQESGAVTGPPLGKTRRAHQMAAQLVNCVTGSMQFGIQDNNRTIASSLQTATFRTQGGTAYTGQDLFTGVYWDTTKDDYNFDSMLYWKLTRPHPMTVTQVGLFLKTQDR